MTLQILCRAGYNYSLGPEQPVVQHLTTLSHMLATSILNLATDSNKFPSDRLQDQVIG